MTHILILKMSSILGILFIIVLSHSQVLSLNFVLYVNNFVLSIAIDFAYSYELVQSTESIMHSSYLIIPFIV